MSAKLIPCPSCDKPISRDAVSCPQCGAMATPGRQSREAATVFGVHPFVYIGNLIGLGFLIWIMSILSHSQEKHPENNTIGIINLVILATLCKGGWETIKLWCQYIEVTPNSFNYRQGVFNQNIVRLPRMGLDIHIERPFLGRIFGYGTVKVQTSKTELSFSGVALGNAARRRLLE